MMYRAAPALLIAAVTAAAAPLVACQGVQVIGALPDASLMQPYSASIAVLNAVGPLRVDLVDGELPSGLSLSPDGTVAGEPLGAGSYTFTVRVVDRRDRWDQAPVTLEVDTDPYQVYLGPALTEDELSQLCLTGVVVDGETRHLLCQPWVRVTGTGMSGQQSRQLTAGVLWVGPDGEANGGWGDDVLLRRLDAADITWTFEPGESTPTLFPEAGPLSPTDAAVDAGGMLRAGELTGPGTVRIQHAELGAGAIDVLVLPPDWCPAPSGC